MLVHLELGHFLIYVVTIYIENNSVFLQLYRTLLFRILILCLDHTACTFAQLFQVNL
jgi:hypothetical protein